MRLSTRAAQAAARRIESASTISRQQQQYQSFSTLNNTSTPRQFQSSKTAIARHRQRNIQSLHTLPLGSSPRSATTTIPSIQLQTQTVRTLHTSNPLQEKSPKPKLAHNNEPIPTSAPETNLSEMDMLGQTPIPSTSVDVCSWDGFTFNSGAIISNGDGALLVGGEAFAWRPWNNASSTPLINAKGQFELTRESLGILDLVWPRPDLLIIGMGRELRPLSPETKKLIASLGMRVDIADTRNAASQFNLLATERGVDDVAALLVPLGWRG